MTNVLALRSLIGAQEFDDIMRRFTEETRARGEATERLGAMKHEPDNSGMTIEQGREALSNAAQRSYDLPAPDKR